MPHIRFPAIVERSDSGFGVFFPDLPGCVSAGTTVDEALESAEQALQCHLNGIIEDGDSLPAPTNLERLPRDPDVIEVARTILRAELPGKYLRLNISLEEGHLNLMDRVANEQGMTRSGLISRATSEYIALHYDMRRKPNAIGTLGLKAPMKKFAPRKLNQFPGDAQRSTASGQFTSTNRSKGLDRSKSKRTTQHPVSAMRKKK